MNALSQIPIQFVLIDDNEIDQLLHRKIIELTVPNAVITQYTGGQEALSAISTKAPENQEIIMLLDIKMPVMDGFQFLEAFENLDNAIKCQYNIYVLSSSSNQFDISKATNNTHVKGMITKPLAQQHLLTILQKF